MPIDETFADELKQFVGPDGTFVAVPGPGSSVALDDFRAEMLVRLREWAPAFFDAARNATSHADVLACEELLYRTFDAMPAEAAAVGLDVAQMSIVISRAFELMARSYARFGDGPRSTAFLVKSWEAGRTSVLGIRGLDPSPRLGGRMAPGKVVKRIAERDEAGSAVFVRSMELVWDAATTTDQRLLASRGLLMLWDGLGKLGRDAAIAPVSLEDRAEWKQRIMDGIIEALEDPATSPSMVREATYMLVREHATTVYSLFESQLENSLFLTRANRAIDSRGLDGLDKAALEERLRESDSICGVASDPLETTGNSRPATTLAMEALTLKATADAMPSGPERTAMQARFDFIVSETTTGLAEFSNRLRTSYGRLGLGEERAHALADELAVSSIGAEKAIALGLVASVLEAQLDTCDVVEAIAARGEPSESKTLDVAYWHLQAGVSMQRLAVEAPELPREAQREILSAAQIQMSLAQQAYGKVQNAEKARHADEPELLETLAGHRGVEIAQNCLNAISTSLTLG